MSNPLAHSGGHLLTKCKLPTEVTARAPAVVAHVRADGKIQSLEAHLRSVSQLTAELAEKFGLLTHGALLGLLHDLGKYSSAFQAYIQSATGLLNQDEDEEFVDAAGLKGKSTIPPAERSGFGWKWRKGAIWSESLGRFWLYVSPRTIPV